MPGSLSEPARAAANHRTHRMCLLPNSASVLDRGCIHDPSSMIQRDGQSQNRRVRLVRRAAVEARAAAKFV